MNNEIMETTEAILIKLKNTSQGGPMRDKSTGNKIKPLITPIRISADITTKKYLKTNSNSEKASIKMPNKVDEAPCITGTNTRSIQAHMR